MQMPINPAQLSAFLAHQLKSAAVSASGHHAAADMRQIVSASRRSSEQTAAMTLAAMKQHLPPGTTPEQARSMAVHAAADTAVSEVKTIYNELIGIQGRLQQNNNMRMQKRQQTAAQRGAAQMQAAAREEINDKRDSISEMSEMEALRLQMAMERLSQMMQMLSNLLKSSAAASSSIVANLKA
jgi:hypothetical protein